VNVDVEKRYLPGVGVLVNNKVGVIG